MFRREPVVDRHGDEAEPLHQLDEHRVVHLGRADDHAAAVDPVEPRADVVLALRPVGAQPDVGAALGAGHHAVLDHHGGVRPRHRGRQGGDLLAHHGQPLVRQG
ncbi:hypothetical protein [Nonomuraea maritima]|uniref:hypothetical protein n=1 Tax=Nonomuraea maritima TaxID=683260 RepID=UPI001FE199AE|nr:hypothetical protein [Nonomuraea maritima]